MRGREGRRQGHAPPRGLAAIWVGAAPAGPADCETGRRDGRELRPHRSRRSERGHDLRSVGRVATGGRGSALPREVGGFATTLRRHRPLTPRVVVGGTAGGGAHGRGARRTPQLAGRRRGRMHGRRNGRRSLASRCGRRSALGPGRRGALPACAHRRGRGQRRAADRAHRDDAVARRRLHGGDGAFARPRCAGEQPVRLGRRGFPCRPPAQRRRDTSRGTRCGRRSRRCVWAGVPTRCRVWASRGAAARRSPRWFASPGG